MSKIPLYPSRRGYDIPEYHTRYLLPGRAAPHPSQDGERTAEGSEPKTHSAHVDFRHKKHLVIAKGCGLLDASACLVQGLLEHTVPHRS